jgi:dihydroorotate dehydrogenase electron transfer subunit
MLETHGIVTRNDRLGADGFWMEIEAPELATLALPGQFVMVHCSDGIDPLTARPFSIADAEGDRVALAYTVVGRGTSLMAAMRPGHRVPLLGPLGRPFSYEAPAKTRVMIAGGIGVAPFPFLARALAQTDPEARCVLLFGGRSRDHLYAIERFRELGTEVLAATDDGSEGHHGLVTDLLTPYLGDPAVRLFACGPTPMFRTIAGMLEGHEAPCEISVEPIMACGFGACYGCVVPFREGDDYTYVKSCEKGPTFEIRDLVVERMEAH